MVWVWMAALGVASLVVCTALGLLIADQVATNGRFDRTRTSLQSAQRHLAAVDTALATAHADLGRATTSVGNDTTALAQVNSELKGAQAALASAKAHVVAQSSLIGSLRTCLGGVTRALNSLAVGKRARALSDLHAVATSCSDAAASSG